MTASVTARDRLEELVHPNRGKLKRATIHLLLELRGLE